MSESWLDNQNDIDFFMGLSDKEKVEFIKRRYLTHSIRDNEIQILVQELDLTEPFFQLLFHIDNAYLKNSRRIFESLCINRRLSNEFLKTYFDKYPSRKIGVTCNILLKFQKLSDDMINLFDSIINQNLYQAKTHLVLFQKLNDNLLYRYYFPVKMKNTTKIQINLISELQPMQEGFIKEFESYLSLKRLLKNKYLNISEEYRKDLTIKYEWFKLHKSLRG